jgi:hypothetical protein
MPNTPKYKKYCDAIIYFNGFFSVLDISVKSLGIGLNDLEILAIYL